MTTTPMTLIQLRNEVLGHGFDPIQYGSRINMYLNDAQNDIARRANYYGDEAMSTFATVAGTDTYPWPTGLARMRSIFNTDLRQELTYASLREMDRSAAVNGRPMWYAISGPNTRLYPVPDGVYNHEIRYWQMPLPLVNDTDIPSLPADYHTLLWVYAVARCFKSDDDVQTAQAWEADFDKGVSKFTADQKFPDTDSANRAAGMWDPEPSLSPQGGWSLWNY